MKDPLVVVQPTYQLRVVVGEQVQFQQLWTHTSYDKDRIKKSVKMEWRVVPTFTEEEARAVDAQTGALDAQAGEVG